jgi:hypothetical protein
MRMTWFEVAAVPCCWYWSARVRSGPVLAQVHLGFGWYVREGIPQDKETGLVRARASTQKQWNRHTLALRNKAIGILLGIHSETMESACACTQKQRYRHALAYPPKNKEIGMCLRTHSETKESVCACASAQKTKRTSRMKIAKVQAR